MNPQASVSNRKSFAAFCVFVLCITMLTSTLPAQRVLDREDKKGDDPVPTLDTWMNWNSFWCKAVNDSSNSNLQHVTTDNEIKLNYTPSTSSTTFPFKDNTNPSRDLTGPEDLTRTITTQRSGNSLNWSSQKAISAVIIGASSGNPGRVYWYPSGGFSGSNLQNPNKTTITSVNFCFYQPAKVTLIKQASPFNGTGASTTAFPFSSTNLSSPSNFTLTDNNAQPADRKIVTDLYKFAKLGSSNWITVTEALVTGWSLADIECAVNDTIPDQVQYSNVIDFANRKVTIKLEEGEEVTCTYSNVQLSPSAGSAEVSGRITDSSGRGIANAWLTLTNPSTGAVMNARTSSFGYYRFEGLEVAELYFLTASHKRYLFAPDTLTFTLDSDLADQNFVALPKYD